MKLDPKKINYILVDDHQVLRLGLKHILQQDESFNLLGEAENGIKAVELVKEMKPNMVLLDILMPRMNGIDAARVIKKSSKKTKVVIFTALDDLNHIEQAIASGADGYLIKASDMKGITESLKQVHLGKRVFSEAVLLKMQDMYINPDKPQKETVFLTRREQEVLNVMALGKSTKETADMLFLSERTIEKHRANIMKKLKITSAAGLVRYAVLHHSTESTDMEYNMEDS